MRLPLRTRVFAELSQRTGHPVSELTEDDILRGRLPPAQGGLWAPLVGWIVGRLDPAALAEDVWLPGADGELRARVYRPRAAPADGTPLPVVVRFHGGGFVLGHHEADWLGSRIAVRVGALVVSVDYRLAPHHRNPAARDDCYAVTRWLGEHADVLGGDGDRLAVMGDSAGGTLAAVVALMARDRGGPALRAQLLAYPATDATFSSPSVDAVRGPAVLTRADLVAYRDHYLGPDGDPTDPYVSPALAPDLRGLPPALVQTAEWDSLVDDGHHYAEALAAAGVPVRATCYVGTLHGFLSSPGIAPQPAEQALSEICAELAAALF